VMYHWWPPTLTAFSAGLSGLAGSKESAGASGSGSGWIAIHGAPEGAGITPFAIPSEYVRGAADLKGAAEVNNVERRTWNAAVSLFDRSERRRLNLMDDEAVRDAFRAMQRSITGKVGSEHFGGHEAIQHQALLDALRHRGGDLAA
jgi:hypothetical protein